jgi:hypothetical membrane protein
LALVCSTDARYFLKTNALGISQQVEGVRLISISSWLFYFLAITIFVLVALSRLRAKLSKLRMNYLAARIQLFF